MPFPTSIQYIRDAEQELNVIFPDGFKSRMLKMNGGELETDDDVWQLFPFFDKSDKKLMSRTSNHIVLETGEAREWKGFPERAVAIASNGCGNYLILMPAYPGHNSLKENIYVWHHENGEITQLASAIDVLEGK